MIPASYYSQSETVTVTTRQVRRKSRDELTAAGFAMVEKSRRPYWSRFDVNDGRRTVEVRIVGRVEATITTEYH